MEDARNQKIIFEAIEGVAHNVRNHKLGYETTRGLVLNILNYQRFGARSVTPPINFTPLSKV